MASLFDTSGEAGPTYDELNAFHHCKWIVRLKEPDEQGDNACTASLCEGRALACPFNTKAKLVRCMDYEGPLLEEMQRARGF
jgi:hypothetical protein